MTNRNPKYPSITVQLHGQDGNAFSVMARVVRALRKGGATPEEITEFQTEATSSDYKHLLRTCMEWVNVE